MKPTDAMNPITEDDIANYLANTPDFFARHSELLAAVHLTSPHSHRAVSLQERQAEMLREKIKALEHRLMDMVRHGNENVIIADRLQRWARNLLQVRSGRSLPATIASELANQFMVPQVAIKVWDVDSRYGSEMSIDEFRNAMKDNLRYSDRVVLLNFDRKSLNEVGGGHWSPLAAYHPASDSVLVMDVARYKYPPLWVSVKELFAGTQGLDSVSGKSRGVVVISKQ